MQVLPGPGRQVLHGLGQRPGDLVLEVGDGLAALRGEVDADGAPVVRVGCAADQPAPFCPVGLIRYKVKPDQAERNVALLRDFFAELEAARPGGIRYATREE